MTAVFARLFFITTLLMAMPALAAPNVNVRGGIHDRYNRMVFDWPSKTDYKITQNGNNVTIQFNAPANAKFGPVQNVKPPLIRNLQQTNTAAGLQVTFQAPDGSKVEGFRSGNSLAFDVLHMNNTPPKFTNTSLKEPAKEEPKPVEAAPTPAPVAAPAATPEPAPQSKPIYKLQTLADRLNEKPSDKELKSTPAPAAAPVAAEQVEQQRIPEVAEGSTLIHLAPVDMTRLAAFTRAGKLWLVLDKPLEGLSPDIKGQQLEMLSKNATRIGLKNAVAFVFDAPPADTVFSIQRLQNDWLIWLNPGNTPFLPDDIPVNTKTDGNPPKTIVSLYAGEQPSVISFKDKAVGDRLWVVPMRSPEGRIVQERVTPGYRVLPTLMGAVLTTQDDNIKVASMDDLVAITSDKGDLLVSTPDDRAKGITQASQVPLFDLTLPDLKKEDFIPQRQEIETKITKEKDPEKKVPFLLELARLNIRNGFGPEANGILRITKSLDADIENQRDYQALRGMTAALTADIQQAKNDLTSPAIQSQPAAKLWLGYALARNNDWEKAKLAFAETGNVVNSFPQALKARMILAKAESYLQADDIANTDLELRKITSDIKLLPSEKAAYDYIHATSALMAKDKEASLPVYEQLIKGSNQLYKVRSQLAYTDQQLTDKKIDLKQAIQAMERLRFDWRGDRLEIDILRRLGQYYIDNKQYMEGLEILRQAASLSKNSIDTDAITNTMQQTFSKLYVDGEADKINTLQAVALFDRFRELTPPGEAGNVAMMRLADRLAEADLLPRADTLLEKQLHQNAVGEQAAMIGAKLASWRLLDKNPSGALKALDESTQDGNLPESLSKKRLLMRARALADLGKTEEALSLLSTDTTPEAYSLKADINWRQSRWSDAVEALQTLVNHYRDDGDTAVDGPMPPLILKMATAMTLDDNKRGLELLVAQYGEFMATTSKVQAFSVITKPSNGGTLADLDTLQNEVGEVELFQTFLKDFSK